MPHQGRHQALGRVASGAGGALGGGNNSKGGRGHLALSPVTAVSSRVVKGGTRGLYAQVRSSRGRKHAVSFPVFVMEVEVECRLVAGCLPRRALVLYPQLPFSLGKPCRHKGVAAVGARRACVYNVPPKPELVGYRVRAAPPPFLRL